MRSEQGNIFVEALIAVAILAVGLLPVFGGWAMTAGAREQVGRKTAALAVARGQIEQAHAITGADWDLLTGTQAVAHPDFSITRRFASRPDLAGAKDVTVTVAWKDRAGKDQSVVLTTSVARRP